MGTRSVVRFQEDGDTICAIYQQYDGYIEGVGAELYEFLKDVTIVNGLSGDNPERIANGMGCLAAQYIADHKDGAGGFYMTDIEDSQSYNYIVNSYWEGKGWVSKPGTLTVTVEEYGDEVFSGSVEEFGEFIERHKNL